MYGRRSFVPMRGRDFLRYIARPLPGYEYLLTDEEEYYFVPQLRRVLDRIGRRRW